MRGGGTVRGVEGGRGSGLRRRRRTGRGKGRVANGVVAVVLEEGLREGIWACGRRRRRAETGLLGAEVDGGVYLEEDIVGDVLLVPGEDLACGREGRAQGGRENGHRSARGGERARDKIERYSL